jgi:hypothetical protein
MNELQPTASPPPIRPINVQVTVSSKQKLTVRLLDLCSSFHTAQSANLSSLRKLFSIPFVLLDAGCLNALEIPTIYVWSSCNFFGLISLQTPHYDSTIEKRHRTRFSHSRYFLCAGSSIDVFWASLKYNSPRFHLSNSIYLSVTGSARGRFYFHYERIFRKTRSCDRTYTPMVIQHPQTPGGIKPWNHGTSSQEKEKWHSCRTVYNISSSAALAYPTSTDTLSLLRAPASEGDYIFVHSVKLAILHLPSARQWDVISTVSGLKVTGRMVRLPLSTPWSTECFPLSWTMVLSVVCLRIS